MTEVRNLHILKTCKLIKLTLFAAIIIIIIVIIIIIIIIIIISLLTLLVYDQLTQLLVIAIKIFSSSVMQSTFCFFNRSYAHFVVRYFLCFL